MTETSSQRLGRFAAELTFADLPTSVVEHIKLCLLDTLGCGLYGSTLPWTEHVLHAMQAVDDTTACAVWGSSSRLSAPYAALVNGTAVHAFELDDLHPRSILHPGSVVAPAAFTAAALRGGVSGPELLTALVAGYEVGARAGSAVGAAHLLAGWHPTGTHGTLAAAAGASSLLGLSAGQSAHALGIAGSQSSGLMASQYGAMVKRLNAGHAAQSGVQAALLAQRGFTGIEDLFGGDYGGYLTTFSPSSDPEVITRALGSDWEVERVGFKPYSTNGSCHPAIDALLHLRQAEGLQAADVESVHVWCSSATLKHVGWSYVPDSVTTAQMNLPYIVSAVLTDGDAFVDQFTAERIADPALVEMSQRVRVEADPEIDARGDGARHATRLEVRLRSGGVLQERREYAKGSSRSPLPAADVVEKFHKLASKALDEQQVHRLREAVEELDTSSDIAPLADLLTPGAAPRP